MPVAFNPSASLTPNPIKIAGADDAAGPVPPDQTFARLLSAASDGQPKAAASPSQDRPDPDSPNGDELATDVAATAPMVVPWLPLGLPPASATDTAVAVETGVVPDAVRRDATAAIGGVSNAESVPGPGSGNDPTAVASAFDPTTVAKTAASAQAARPAGDEASAIRNAGAEAIRAAVADRPGDRTRGNVDRAPAATPAVGDDPHAARPWPSGAAPDPVGLRTGSVRSSVEAAQPAVTVAGSTSPPELMRESTGAKGKAALDTVTGSQPPLTPPGAAVLPAAIAIATPVGAAGWSAEVVQKVAQVILFRNETAEIRLNPPQLGPVDVRISFATDQPTLLITAPDPATRGALEQALPHLRDLLAQHGITLGQASVQGERQSPQAFAPPPRDPPAVGAGTVNAAGDALPRAARADWLVDLYA